MKHVLFLALVLGGCAVDGPIETRLEPLGPGRYGYQARTHAIGHHGELEWRRAWLDELLDERGACPDGYWIEDRKVLRADAIEWLVQYELRCL